jgi:hypothetical protein
VVGAMTAATETHNCGIPWCISAPWSKEHNGADYTPATGHPVCGEDVTVGVVSVYDEAKDTVPKILLHIQAPEGETDQDAGPTADEARWIAAKLIEAADAADRWLAQR